MKNIIFSIGASFISISVLPVQAATEHKNFNAVLQCRAIENNKEDFLVTISQYNRLERKLLKNSKAEINALMRKMMIDVYLVMIVSFLQHLLHL